jgi:hypothetical protein
VLQRAWRVEKGQEERADTCKQATPTFSMLNKRKDDVREDQKWAVNHVFAPSTVDIYSHTYKYVYS